MLEVNYKSKDGRFQAKFSGETPNVVFEQVSVFQEVFEKNNTCGLCNSDVYFNVRKVNKSKFYEKKCSNPKCSAAFTYHINENNAGLYSTYKDKWEKWTPGKDKEDDAEVFEDKKSSPSKNKK